MNGNPRPVIPDTISGQLRAGLSPEFLSPYADGEVANRPVLLHQLSDATILVGGSAINQHPHIDPVGTLVFQTCPDDVRTVSVDGKIVKRNGVLQGVNLPQLTARADESADAILDREIGRAHV